MSDRPIRIQGGVFLWICALLAVMLAISRIVACYSGLGKLVLVVAISVSLGTLARKVWQRCIERGGSSAGDENGPLLAMAVASGGISAQCLYAGEAISFMRVFAASLMVALFAIVAVFTARGVNRFNFNVSYSICVRKYAELDQKAQFVCIALVLVPLFALIFSIAILLVKGIDSLGVAAFTSLVIAMAVYSVCLASMRLKILRIVHSRYLERDDLKGAVKTAPFIFYEYMAAFATAGLAMLVFLLSPRMQVSHYLLVLGLGVPLACLAETVFVGSDRVRVSGWLRDLWRRDVTCKILTGQVEYLRRKSEHVTEQVLGAIDFKTFDAKPSRNAVSRRAEALRRTLNYYCCERGKMKYISSCETVPKSEQARAWAVEKLQTILTFREYDEAACAVASDDQLEAILQTISSSDDFSVSPAYISALRGRLFDLIGGAKFPDAVRMKTTLRNPNGDCEVTMEVSELEDVRISIGNQMIVASFENIVTSVCGLADE